MRERYTHGHFGSVVEDHATRTAANSAAFLLPHLKTDHRLLDMGCGPGSITLDLATQVADVVGIDAAPEAIERATTAAAARHATNVEFVIGTVYELAAADNTFDVVFAHQVLQHLGDPVAALVEAKRVLKPGGIVAVRDADYGTMVHDPHDALIDRWLELYHRLATANGGDADAGRKLTRWVTAAGFGDIASSTSTWTYSTPPAIECWRGLWTSRMRRARIGRDLVATEMATAEEVEAIADAFDRWAASEHPFFAFLHGEVLARKPGGAGR